MLRLVEDQQMQRLLAQHGDVACEQGVAGQQQVVIGEFGEVLLSAATGKRQQTQPRRETGRFILPVGDQAGRHHHQRRAIQTSGLLFGEDVRQALQCLAETHVIAEDAAGAQFAEGLHPGQTLQLVGPQGGVQRARRLARLSAWAVQTSGECTQPLASAPVCCHAF